MLSRDDRGDGIEEEEVSLPRQVDDLFGKRWGSQRAGGNDDQSIRYAGQLFSYNLNARVILDALGYRAGENIAVNGKRAAGWHRRALSTFEEHGAESPKFILKNARCAIGKV